MLKSLVVLYHAIEIGHASYFNQDIAPVHHGEFDIYPLQLLQR